jgi:branched-chain amino acid transport system permease protein
MSYSSGILIQVGIAILLALGYWITANTGRFSFGHAGFMAIGAYGASILTQKLGWPLPPAMLAGGLAAALAGALIGWASLRLSVLYLAIVTLAFAQLVQVCLSNWSYVGGDSGIAGMTGTSLPLVATCVVVLLCYLWLVSRSRVGLALAALREDEQAARAAGLNTTKIATSAFSQSAFVTGVGGALSAHYLLFISPGVFGAQQSLMIILYVVLGGLAVFWGPVLGATLLSLFPVYMTFLEGSYMFVYGGLFVVLMIVRPQGIIGPSRRRWWRRRSPASEPAPVSGHDGLGRTTAPTE